MSVDSDNQPARNLLCAVFPGPLLGNPYQSCLHRELSRRGVKAVFPKKLTLWWALRSGGIDAVHLHWIEYLIKSHRTNPAGALVHSTARAARMLTALAVYRLTGRPLVWTVHNIAPHESRFPRLERLSARSAAHLSTTLLVHSNWAGEQVVAHFGKRIAGRIRVAPHGHYREVYRRETRTRAAARVALRLPPQAFVYLVFGEIRQYKRVAETMREFSRLKELDAVLLVVGRAIDLQMRERLERTAEADPRIVFREGYVPDDQVATYFAASDAAVLNYSEVFTSGALLLALTFGIPVVAPTRGSISEIAGGAATELFEEGDLLAGLIGIREGDQEQRRKEAERAGVRAEWARLADAAIAGYVASPAPG